MADIEGRTLNLSAGADDGDLLVVSAAGTPVLTVTAAGAVVAGSVTLDAVGDPIEDVPEAGLADAADNAVAINAILVVLRDVGLVPPTPEP